MANTKISQLPSYTGTAADLRWFVMNNSGENTTFKFSGYTSPYKIVGTNNSNNIYDTNAMGGTYSAIIGGLGNTNTGTKSAILAGNANSQTSNEGIILGGTFNNNNSYSSVVGGYGNTAGAGCDTAFLFGGSCSVSSGSFGALLGGVLNSLSGNRSSMMGGQQNVVNAPYSQILNGISNTISSSSPYNTIIGSNDSSITGGTNVVMLGTSGRTATADNTTYVENIHTFRTPSTQVQPVVSGTVFTCNIELGGKAQYYITGTSTINITNVRDGASFMIKTQTDGNYNMTWTATGGYTFVFEGGIKDPGNNVTDIFVFEVFGSVIYGNRRHNYS